ncbi:Hypothetical predicted protein [Mytilus galloprovincialis]|uniref:Reverse transcriptase domain-containing protein n=1 Tax=Mytilus galloprovincialis TaxID=29158 RepID=A0A8B6FI47_MYTGA|nr:Hypothetical predicted protein [Mytilus galloprovincialis]
MPNGLSSAPRVFTKLLKPVLSSLRKEGYVNCAYIDDILLISDSHEECSNNVKSSLMLFDSLGFTIHDKKSVVTPTTKIEFLGFEIDSVNMTVRLTAKKVANIVNLSVDMLGKVFITVREFAKLIGKLVAAEHGVLYAPLFYKTLEIQKDFELKINKGNFESKMKLSKESRDCINWWILNLPYSFKPIVFKSPDRKIESDSSMIGYGAHDVTNNLDMSGKLNIKADALSRQKLNADMEWMIVDNIFAQIMDKFGPCDIDLFASKYNYRLDKYVSFGPDVKAFAVNAFSLNWSDYYAYIFPPFSVLSAVLQKICLERATAVVIAPLFSTQPWFPVMLKLVCKQPYILPKVQNILQNPKTSQNHQLKNMRLGVFMVSGKNCVKEAFQKTLPISSLDHGEKVHKNNMGHISKSGCFFVTKKRLINLIHL